MFQGDSQTSILAIFEDVTEYAHANCPAGRACDQSTESPTVVFAQAPQYLYCAILWG
jgi:hypothetical protein